jgi:hypothetical protein
MKQASKNRILERRKETGRLWTQPEIIDYLQVSGPTFFRLEQDYRKRGGKLRRLKFGRKTIRYFDDDIQKFIASAMESIEPKPAK